MTPSRNFNEIGGIPFIATLSSQKVETPTELSKTSEGESQELENELGSLEYSDLLRQVMNQSSEQSADIMVHETSSSDEENLPQTQVKIE